MRQIFRIPILTGVADIEWTEDASHCFYLYFRRKQLLPLNGPDVNRSVNAIFSLYEVKKGGKEGLKTDNI
jgi:hypothetical protein